jgi:hypothetical protein
MIDRSSSWQLYVTFAPEVFEAASALHRSAFRARQAFIVKFARNAACRGSLAAMIVDPR